MINKIDGRLELQKWQKYYEMRETQEQRYTITFINIANLSSKKNVTR